MNCTTLSVAVLVSALLGIVTVAVAGDEITPGPAHVSAASVATGATSRERVDAHSLSFNLKLVFATESGENLHGVRVSIADPTGRTIVNTTSERPVYLSRLPPGTYQIVATHAGKAATRAVAVDAHEFRTVDFRWATEARREVISAQ